MVTFAEDNNATALKTKAAERAAQAFFSGTYSDTDGIDTKLLNFINMYMIGKHGKHIKRPVQERSYNLMPCANPSFLDSFCFDINHINLTKHKI